MKREEARRENWPRSISDTDSTTISDHGHQRRIAEMQASERKRRRVNRRPFRKTHTGISARGGTYHVIADCVDH